jgi:predicted DNA-binding protein
LICCDMCGASIAGPRLGRQENRLQGMNGSGRASLKCSSLSAACEDVTPMSFKDLLESWRESAAQPRTATEYAVRLPVDDAARLAALSEMFPGRTSEQLITDLLGTALQEIETSMPYVAGKKVISSDEQGDPIYEDVGLTPRFVELTRKNRKKLEAELSKNK